MQVWKILPVLLELISFALFQFYIVLSHAAGTYLVSYVLHMFFEAPFLSLTDVIARRCKGHTFNSEIPDLAPMTEKPVRYSGKVEKININSNNFVNSLEKGQNWTVLETELRHSSYVISRLHSYDYIESSSNLSGREQPTWYLHRTRRISLP